MQLEKKAFKTVFNLIKSNQLDEKEAYTLVEAIFAINYQYVPVPTPITTEEKEDKPVEVPIEVKGFTLNN